MLKHRKIYYSVQSTNLILFGPQLLKPPGKCETLDDKSESEEESDQVWIKLDVNKT